MADVDRRTRTRALLVLGAGLAIVLALVTLVAGPGLVVRFSPASVAFEDGAPAIAVEGFDGPDGTYVVGYEHDSYTTFTVALTNRGPATVQVLDVRMATHDAPLFVQAERPEPVDIAPGEVAHVELPVRFDNCEAYHEREAMLVEHVEVTARVWGRRTVEHVALDRPMMARSPMLWQCPDRTIDREDDRRGG